ncbi:ROK family protein [Actinopolymorpha singaporensis]|uniref:Glucokinase n=1 Tax=Actinopolymorpha singaporensis TaxID=117157 RepID=A0A1H1YZF4_9ACTN|nr:ROK family protein [Actinopolymorpha singaporensis]SDT26702.1 glucokinase [Actinopolymorpha singaporensis]
MTDLEAGHPADARTEPVLAVDIGGTKIAAGVVDADGRVLVSDRAPTLASHDDDADAIWARLHALCESVLDAAGRPAIQGVGVGCGGPMRWPEGAVSPVNLLPWRDFPLRARLAAAYPGLPVRVHNDAVAVVVAEHWQGAGRGVANMLGMVVSTGVGGGLILGGRLIDGGSGNAGHVGHMVVDPQGPPCGCGSRGCVEAFARGPGLAAWAREQGWRPNDPTANARDLADDARADHKVARAAFERAGWALGLGIASAVALCDVERVVLGGGVSQVGPLLFDPLERTLREYARMEFTRHVKVERPILDQDAGIVGAAGFILRGDRYWSAD